MSKIQIGLLNFSETDRVRDHIESVQELIDYARAADQLGFSRFWLGEHYIYKKAQTWTSPEMLLPIIASSTDRIKVGIAGSLISAHHPFDIATNFKLLANLFPGRIDLGLAKGGGMQQPSDSDVLTGQTSGKPGNNEVFIKNVRCLNSYLQEEQLHFNNGVVIPPLSGNPPDIWLLGSSYKNLGLALELGANFSRSMFHLNHHPDPDIGSLLEFNRLFNHTFKREPQVNLAIAGCCHEDQFTANRIVNSNCSKGLLSLDTNTILAGSPTFFYDQLHRTAEKYNVKEFILLQLYQDQRDRLNGIELIANTFGLE